MVHAGNRIQIQVRINQFRIAGASPVGESLIFITETSTPVNKPEYYGGDDTFITIPSTPTNTEEMATLSYYMNIGMNKYKLLMR